MCLMSDMCAECAIHWAKDVIVYMPMRTGERRWPILKGVNAVSARTLNEYRLSVPRSLYALASACTMMMLMTCAIVHRKLNEKVCGTDGGGGERDWIKYTDERTNCALRTKWPCISLRKTHKNLHSTFLMSGNGFPRIYTHESEARHVILRHSTCWFRVNTHTQTEECQFRMKKRNKMSHYAEPIQCRCLCHLMF